MTGLMVAACVVVFGYEVWLAMERGQEALGEMIGRRGVVPVRFLAGWQTWEAWATVGSSMFLHGGVGHLLGNCWFLYIFGKPVEDRLGGLGFLFFYAACGVVAAGAQILAGPGSDVPMIGASGAISGVLGAYFVMFPKAWVVALVPWVVPVVPLPAVVFLLGWFLLQAWSGVGSLVEAGGAGGVAWWAHAGGFLAGAGWAWIIGGRRT